LSALTVSLERLFGRSREELNPQGPRFSGECMTATREEIMGTVIVGPWKPRPTSERIEHEKSILQRISELHHLRPQEQTPPKEAPARIRL
jgi:hypothetical protein